MNWTDERTRWQQFLEAHFGDERQRVIVACSGGIDSMVLLHALNRLQSEAMPRLSIEVAHVNYRLRAEDSDLDQRLVERQAALLGYPFHLKLAKDPPQRGLQLWARQLRRDFFDSLREDEHCIIAVAHQKNDLAENVLLRMSRGCGFDIAGMSAFDHPYWRPLLDIPRRSIETWAGRQKVPYRDDDSNAKLIYSRNKIRHQVLPQLEDLHRGASERIADLARDWQDVEAYFQQQYCSVLQADHLRSSDLKGLPRPIALTLVAQFIKLQAGSIQLSRALLLRVASKLTELACQPAAQAWSEDLPGTMKLRIDATGLRLVAKSESFSLRASQHRANIRSLQMPAQLEPGASLEYAGLKQEQS